MRKLHVAILGAGPVGLEAALYARALGHDAAVYERGGPGENVLRWGFVRLFSPWKLNVSPLGLRELGRQGLQAPDLEAFPTGRELVDLYLRPVANSLGRALREGVEVRAVSRTGLLKIDCPGGKRRTRAPFRILLRSARGEEEEALADVVIDATGVHSSPGSLGDGGIPALGEEAARSRIHYHIPDVLGAERAKFAEGTTLLVGAGFSAATTLLDLIRLRRDAPRARAVWLRRSTGPDPLPVHENDPLPERARIAREANHVAADSPEGVQVLSGATVRAVRETAGRLVAELRTVDGGGATGPVEADRIVANVGYRPDGSIHRELQVHQCYASEGPMALAASLLGGAGGDCLLQSSPGPDVLKSPEAGFYILGSKSYGRRNDFLLRVGREQVRDVFRLIEGDPGLDLYSRDAPARVEAGA